MAGVQKEIAMSTNLDIEGSADEIADSHENELDTLNDKEFAGDADSRDESQEDEPAERE